jgi:hypothetical protein
VWGGFVFAQREKFHPPPHFCAPYQNVADKDLTFFAVLTMIL